MGLSEINRPLDARSKQTEMSTKPRDFIRPASSQGQKPEKLQLASECTPEHPILPGGMPKRWWWKARHDDQASTSRDMRAQDSDQMSARESRSPEHSQRDSPTMLSCESSPSRDTRESRSPEWGERRGQLAPSEGESSTMDQLLERMRSAVEREKQTRGGEQQRLHQELDRVHEQLRNAEQERDQARQELRARDSTLQELMEDLWTGARRQMQEESESMRQQVRTEEQQRAQQELRAREETIRQEIRAEEHRQVQVQLANIQRERDQARQERDQVQQELRARENNLQGLMDDILANLQQQPSDNRASDEKVRQQIRDEEERRVLELVQARVEQMRPQIRDEEKRQAQDQAWTRWQERQREELQEREQFLQGALQRRQSPREVQTREGQHQRIQRLQTMLRENQGSQEIRLPRDLLERFLQDERKLEQEWQAEGRRLQGERASLHEALEGLPRERLREQLRQRVDDVLRRQPAREQLRNQLLELRGLVLRDYRELEPQQNRLSAEFQGVLEEQWKHHGRPEQELRIILGDLTGRGPER